MKKNSISLWDKIALLNHRKKLFILVFIGFIVVISTFCFYIKIFGTRVVADYEKWGQFGDFIGGTTNPILAFLTFIGVIWTISLAYDEKHNNETNEKKNDLYKIIETISNEIDLKINKKIVKNTMVMNHVYTTETNLSICDYGKLNRNDFSLSKFKEENKYLLNEVAILFETLTVYLKKYDELSKDRIVSDYNRIKFINTVAFLNDIKMINDNDFKYFCDIYDLSIKKEIKT